MKGIKLLILLLLTGMVAFAQGKVDKKADKKARKEAKMAEDRANAARLMALFESRRFVLQAERLYDKHNESFVLADNLNFIMYEEDKATIQLSFQELVGWNGLGGVTLDGEIEKMEITKNKKGVGFTANSVIKNDLGGVTNLIFSVNASGQARVTLYGSFGSRLVLEGRIVTLEDASIYKGSPRY